MPVNISRVLKRAAYSLNNLDEDDPHFDVYALLKIMWDQWNNVFSTTLGHAERSLVSELRSVRNRPNRRALRNGAASAFTGSRS